MGKVNSSLTFACGYSCHRTDETMPDDSLSVISSSFYFLFESSTLTGLDFSSFWTRRKMMIALRHSSFACVFLDVQNIKDYTYWYVQIEQTHTPRRRLSFMKIEKVHTITGFKTRTNTPNRPMNFETRIWETVTRDERNKTETVLV